MTNSDQIISIISFVLFMMLLFLFCIALAIRYRRRKQDSARLQAGFSLELQKVKSEMQEQTLRYVSQELHDNLGQIASLIKIHLHTIDLPTLPPAAREKVEDTSELIRRLTRDIKLLSAGLNRRASYQSFVQAVRNEVSQLNKTGLFTATMMVADDFPEPDDEKGLLVFRMVQEALNNIIKHSQATEVHVGFWLRDGQAVLELRDNGVGFDPAVPASGESSGLNNLRARSRLINADLAIQSAPSQGTTVTIILN